MANDSREAILEKIRQALTKSIKPPTELAYPVQDVYHPSPSGDMVVQFAEIFTARKGIFFYAQGLEEFRIQIHAFVKERGFKSIHAWEPELIEELKFSKIDFASNDRNIGSMDCGITLCECLLSRTGSILVSSRQLAGRRLTIYPPTHIVVASAGQMVPDIKEAMTFMQKKYGDKLPSMISMVTGASRTADIERTLVMGAHGPKELILFLIDDAEARPNS